LAENSTKLIQVYERSIISYIQVLTISNIPYSHNKITVYHI